MAGLIYIFTGDGKGKTTAAIGQAVRAVGHDWKVLFIQFIKRDVSGELEPLKRLGVEVYTKGLGFIGTPDDKKLFNEHREAAKEALGFAKAKARDGEYNLLVLDEINVAVSLGLVKEGEVLRFLRARPKGLSVILTGRKAPESFIEAADLVTEMGDIKHPMEKGHTAKPGLEY